MQSHLKSTLLAAAALSLAATSAQADEKTVCYVTAASAHAYVTPANEAIEARTAELGYELITLNQDFDVQKGVEQINTCIARQADGMILWPMDPQAYLPGVVRANAAGIETILINSPMDAAANDYIASFTGPDNYEQGQIVAGLMNAELGGKGSVVIVSGSAGHGTSIERVGGFTDRLAELNSDIEVLTVVNANWDQQKALEVSRDVIVKFGKDIDGVYGIGDMMSIGFLDAWKEVHGTDDVPAIMGINGQKDAFEAIKNGTMVATLLQSPYEDGLLAINTMADALNGAAVDKRIAMEMVVVNSSNVNSLEPAF